MKISKFSELETSKRAMTLGRFGVIAAAHVVIFGGGYLVTKYGSGSETQTAQAGANGLMTWSSQSADAQKPTVADDSVRPFDTRGSNVSGYNYGDPVMASADASSGSKVRVAPRRPTGNSTPSTSNSRASTSRDDEMLTPEPANSEPFNFSQTPGESLQDQFEYKVQNGDSIWGISKRFGVSVSEIVSVNPGIKANAIQVGQALMVPRRGSSTGSAEPTKPAPTKTPAPTSGFANGINYTVKSGDSLSRIASQQGVTVSALKSANGMTNDMIRIGQVLVIPGASRTPELASRQYKGQQVVLEPGDTLEKIAAIYGVSVTELKELNSISDPRLIRIGQTIKIPETSRSTATIKEQPPKQNPPRSVPTRELPPRLSSGDEVPVDAVTPLPDEYDSLPALPDDFEDQPVIPIQE